MKAFFAVCIILAVFGQILADPSYGYGGHAPVGPSYTYSYPSPAPHVKCGSNLLIGCHPQAGSVPCHGYSHGGYSAPKY